mgnify:CR=1 FL=1
MPILLEINDTDEMEKKILAKNYSWLSLGEKDIEKKIEYNENTRIGRILYKGDK